MILRLIESGSARFKRFMRELEYRNSNDGGAVDDSVRRILAEVRREGDRALIRLTRRFDRVSLNRSTIRVGGADLQAARASLDPPQSAALELAARRIAAFHRRTLERSFSYLDSAGMRLGQIVTPLQRVGIYVPGGQGAYPSTVLMNAIPARVAGVEEIVMVSPASPKGDHPAVMAAAAIAGIDEVYRIGGSQAIAALAYGTATIRAVDKIVGPGNSYVQAAKRMLYGVVDIDKIAGPSEVVVIADSSARPDWVAADLIAQAEHGSGDEAAVVITPSRDLATQVAVEIGIALKELPRAEAVRGALARRGAALVVKDLDEAFEVANRIAPEHLELELRDPERWLKQVRTAGAVFLGASSPAPFGDYLAGPNHVLPTGGAARFASPLGAYDFLKRTSIIGASPAALQRLGPAVARLARMEGFEGHARAVELRYKSKARPSDKNGR
jgi:histidinol dehydrogenase